MKKWSFALLLLACLVAAGYWFVAIPATSTPNGSESRARFNPGPYEVDGERFTIVDRDRATPAFDGSPERPERELDGELWRPADRALPGPLVIYSHGFLSFRQEAMYLARFLASHGYTVAAVDFPLTSIYALDDPQMVDVANQPGDVSFLIDYLLMRNADPGDPLFATIDSSRIAAAGISLGGLTSTLLTFHRALRDPRIAALVSIAGPTTLFTADFFTASEAPMLMIYGSADAIVPMAQNADPVMRMRPGTVLVTLADGSHAGFSLPTATVNRFMDNPDEMACRMVGEKMEGMDIAAQQGDFTAILGDAEDGIDLGRGIEFCTSPPIPLAMKAARQQMFTTLATHAFLESLFAEDAGARENARRYLLQVLPAENAGEVSVTL
jgi:dienelactone hydrolase